MTTEATPEPQKTPDWTVAGAAVPLNIPSNLLPTEAGTTGRWEALRRDVTPLVSELVQPRWLSVVVPFLVLFVYALFQVGKEWFQWGSPILIQAAVPLLFVWLIWRRRMELVRRYYELAFVFPEDSPKRRGKPWLIPLGCFLMLLGAMLETPLITVGGFVVVSVGAIYFLFGPFILQSIWSCLLFLVLMLPIPEFLLGRASAAFQRVSALVTQLILSIFDKSAEIRSRIMIHTSSNDLVIDPVLGGLNLIVPVVVLTIWYALLRRLTILTTLALLAAGLAGAIVLNVVRLIVFASLLSTQPALWLSVATNWAIVGVTFFGVIQFARILTTKRTVMAELEEEEDNTDDEIEAILRGEQGAGNGSESTERES
ncbi:MAG: hypothetical protein OHK0029_38080 [Armatimonadaceae bacterium]